MPYALRLRVCPHGLPNLLNFLGRPITPLGSAWPCGKTNNGEADTLLRPSSRSHQDCSSHVVTSPSTLISNLFNVRKVLSFEGTGSLGHSSIQPALQGAIQARLGMARGNHIARGKFTCRPAARAVAASGRLALRNTSCIAQNWENICKLQTDIRISPLRGVSWSKSNTPRRRDAEHECSKGRVRRSSG
jgi:hypothetical protein